MRARAPTRQTAFICLLLFIIGLVGLFIPLGHIAIVGPVLAIINTIAKYLLIGGYALLLLAVYVL